MKKVRIGFLRDYPWSEIGSFGGGVSWFDFLKIEREEADELEETKRRRNMEMQERELTAEV